MTIPVELLLALCALSQLVTENLFGAFLRAEFLKLVAIGVGFGLTYGAWILGLEGLAEHPASHIYVMGIAVGLGSTVVNGVLKQWFPAARATPLAGILRNLNRPPAPPTQPPASAPPAPFRPPAAPPGL